MQIDRELPSLQKNYQVTTEMKLTDIEKTINEVKQLLLVVPPVNEAITKINDAGKLEYKSKYHHLLHKNHQKGFFAKKETSPQKIYLANNLAPEIQKQLHEMQKIRLEKQKQMNMEKDTEALHKRSQEIEQKIASLRPLEKISHTISAKSRITKLSSNGRQATFTPENKRLYDAYRIAFEDRPLGAKLGSYNVGRYLSTNCLTAAIEFDIGALEEERQQIISLISQKS